MSLDLPFSSFGLPWDEFHNGDCPQPFESAGKAVLKNGKDIMKLSCAFREIERKAETLKHTVVFSLLKKGISTALGRMLLAVVY